MNNLTNIQVTYIFDYGSVVQNRTFITKEHWDSLKAQTLPLENEIKALQATITEKTDKEIVSQVKRAVDRLEMEIKKIIPAYTFIVEDSSVGFAILSGNEGEQAKAIIPYNGGSSYKIKYKLLN